MPSNTRQQSRTFNDTSPMEELQQQPQSTRSGPSSKGKVKVNEPEPEVRVRYAVSVECLTHLENAQHGAKSVTNVAIKITLVLNVGPSSGSIKLRLQHYSEKSFQDHSFYIVETKTPKPIIIGHPPSIRLGLI